MNRLIVVVFLFFTVNTFGQGYDRWGKAAPHTANPTAQTDSAHWSFAEYERHKTNGTIGAIVCGGFAAGAIAGFISAGNAQDKADALDSIHHGLGGDYENRANTDRMIGIVCTVGTAAALIAAIIEFGSANRMLMQHEGKIDVSMTRNANACMANVTLHL